MNLLYIATGENINNHIAAHFSICSFLTQGKQINTINLITDTPALYNDLKAHLNIIHVNENLLTEWKGRHKFFWRIKIKALEMICDLYKGEPVLYLDADTFLYKDFKHLKKLMVKGAALMHLDEGKLSAAKGKTLQKMWDQVKQKTFGGITITAAHAMWNAGVVGSPNKKNNEEFVLALNICDEMCEQGVTRRLVEQFAISVALEGTYGLKPAEDTIAHYWSNKEEWNILTRDFFIAAGFKGLGIEEIAKALKILDLSKVAIHVRKRDTNKRLTSLVQKIYPPKNITFVKNDLQE